MFSKNRNKIRNILIAVLPALIVAGFWGFANLEPKASITAPVESGLVGYWNMDNNDISGTTLYDKSGQGNNGTISGATTGVSGKIKQALSFDGENDYVDTGYKIPAGARSYFLWIKYNSLTGPGGYSLTGTQEVGAYTYIGIKDGGQGYLYAGNSGGTFNYTFTTGTWYHVGFTMDGSSTTKIYVNGQQVDTKTYSSDATATQNFLIGRVAAGHYVNGTIDEVRIYNRALTPEEVLQNYNASKRTYIDPSLTDRWKDGLVLLQTFNGQDMDWSTTTAEARDRSGQDNHGDVVGAVPVPGKIGQALSFDGVNDYVSVADSDDWTFGNFTISLWVKADSWAGNWWTRAFVGHDEGGGGTNKWIFSYGNNTLFHINSPAGGGPVINGNAWTAATDVWYFIVLTRSGNTYSFYRDGNSDGSSNNTYTIPNAATPLTIGWGEGSGGFNGTIDEVRIYNRALSATEIKEHYQAGLRKTQPAAQPLP